MMYQTQQFALQKLFCILPVFCATLHLFSKVSGAPAPASGQEYPLKLQPELDSIDVASYLQNERLLKLQFKCLIFDGPCDIVGRWAKPRAKAALLGTCLMCTKTQEKWLEEWFEILVAKFPEMYRAAFAKYVENEGIEISDEEKQRIAEAFKEDKISSGIKTIGKIAPTKAPK